MRRFCNFSAKALTVRWQKSIIATETELYGGAKMTRKPRTKNEEPIIEPNGAEQLVKATKELARILRIKEAQKRQPRKKKQDTDTNS